MRQRHKLTAKQVEHARPGRHGDGGGLSLLVKPTGTRSWTARVTVDGVRRDIGIGGYPAVSLSEARLRNAEMQADARGGDDPAAARRSRVPTFEEAARAVYELNVPRWRSAQTGAQFWASMERYAFPAFGAVPVHRVSRGDVLGVLEPIWTTKREVARKTRQRIRQVFRWAMAHGHIDVNPAGEVIDAALPAQRPARGPHRALHYSAVPDAVAALWGCGASDAVKLSLAFLILTAARSGEAREARWAEIDFDAATWTVPAHRMKSGVAHVVPLSRQAVDVLRKAEALDDGSGLVFPSPLRPGRPLAGESHLKLLKSEGHDTTAHGFRSAFRTWALETTPTPWAVAEMALAHAVGTDVERVYVRSDLREQRRTLMQQWADYCCG